MIQKYSFHTTPGSGSRFRVKLRPNIILDEPDYIDAMLLAPRLDYVRRWEPKDWPLAFFDRLHLLPQKGLQADRGRDGAHPQKPPA